MFTAMICRLYYIQMNCKYHWIEDIKPNLHQPPVLSLQVFKRSLLSPQTFNECPKNNKQYTKITLLA